jgi:predicted 3-demethylubiquinone-9 3-methyltransferase (glyoxalase superfamily)
MNNTPYPCLWFKNEAKEAAYFYCSIFKDSKIKSENPLAVVFELNNTKFMALNGASQNSFTTATSFVINCSNQQEIDYYWQQLGNGGTYNKCGWLIDKYGVSWQVVPTILGELMNDPKKAPKAMYAFMQMSKFEIDKLVEACNE